MTIENELLSIQNLQQEYADFENNPETKFMSPELVDEIKKEFENRLQIYQQRIRRKQNIADTVNFANESSEEAYKAKRQQERAEMNPVERGLNAVADYSAKTIPLAGELASNIALGGGGFLARSAGNLTGWKGLETIGEKTMQANRDFKNWLDIENSFPSYFEGNIDHEWNSVGGATQNVIGGVGKFMEGYHEFAPLGLATSGVGAGIGMAGKALGAGEKAVKAAQATANLGLFASSNVANTSDYIEQTSGKFKPIQSGVSSAASALAMEIAFALGRGRGMNDVEASNYATRMLAENQFAMMGKKAFKQSFTTAIANGLLNGGVGTWIREEFALPDNPTQEDYDRLAGNVWEAIKHETAQGAIWGGFGAIQYHNEVRKLFNQLGGKKTITTPDGKERSVYKINASAKFISENSERLQKEKFPNLFETGSIEEVNSYLDELFKSVPEKLILGKSAEFGEQKENFKAALLREYNLAYTQFNSNSRFAPKIRNAKENKEAQTVNSLMANKVKGLYSQYVAAKEAIKNIDIEIEASKDDLQKQQDLARQKEELQLKSYALTTQLEKPYSVYDMVGFIRQALEKQYGQMPEFMKRVDEVLSKYMSDNWHTPISADEAMGVYNQIAGELSKLDTRNVYDDYNSKINNIVNFGQPTVYGNDERNIPSSVIESSYQEPRQLGYDGVIYSNDERGALPESRQLGYDGAIYPEIVNPLDRTMPLSVRSNEKPILPQDVINEQNKIKTSQSPTKSIDEFSTNEYWYPSNDYKNREESSLPSIKTKNDRKSMGIRENIKSEPSVQLNDKTIAEMKNNGSLNIEQAPNGDYFVTGRLDNGQPVVASGLDLDTASKVITSLRETKSQDRPKMNMPREKMSVSQPRESLPINDKISGKSTSESPSSFKESTSSLNIPQAVKSAEPVEQPSETGNIKPIRQNKIDSTNKIGNKAVRDSESFDTRADMPQSVMTDRSESPAIKNERGKMGLDVEMKQKKTKSKKVKTKTEDIAFVDSTTPELKELMRKQNDQTAVEDGVFKGDMESFGKLLHKERYIDESPSELNWMAEKFNIFKASNLNDLSPEQIDKTLEHIDSMKKAGVFRSQNGNKLFKVATNIKKYLLKRKAELAKSETKPSAEKPVETSSIDEENRKSFGISDKTPQFKQNETIGIEGTPQELRMSKDGRMATDNKMLIIMNEGESIPKSKDKEILSFNETLENGGWRRVIPQEKTSTRLDIPIPFFKANRLKGSDSGSDINLVIHKNGSAYLVNTETGDVLGLSKDKGLPMKGGRPLEGAVFNGKAVENINKILGGDLKLTLYQSPNYPVLFEGKKGKAVLMPRYDDISRDYIYEYANKKGSLELLDKTEVNKEYFESVLKNNKGRRKEKIIERLDNQISKLEKELRGVYVENLHPSVRAEYEKKSAKHIELMDLKSGLNDGSIDVDSLNNQGKNLTDFDSSSENLIQREEFKNELRRNKDVKFFLNNGEADDSDSLSDLRRQESEAYHKNTDLVDIPIGKFKANKGSEIPVSRSQSGMIESTASDMYIYPNGTVVVVTPKEKGGTAEFINGTRIPIVDGSPDRAFVVNAKAVEEASKILGGNIKIKGVAPSEGVVIFSGENGKMTIRMNRYGGGDSNYGDIKRNNIILESAAKKGLIDIADVNPGKMNEFLNQRARKLSNSIKEFKDKQNAKEAERQTKARAEQEKAKAELEAENNSYGGFLDGKKPFQQGAVKKALDKKLYWQEKSKSLTTKEVIDELAETGKLVAKEYNNNGKKSYAVGFRDKINGTDVYSSWKIGKTAYEYAKFKESQMGKDGIQQSRARNKVTNPVSDKELNNFLRGQAKQISKDTGLNFKVVDSVDELRKMFPNNDITDTVEGGIHKDTVYLVRGNIDKNRLPLVIAHEVAGHRGVESLFENKQQMDNFFKSLERASVKDKFIRDAFAEVDRLGYKENRSREAMAKIVEKVRNESGTLKGTAKTFVNFIASRVRRFLRKLGFKNLQLNEAEVYDLAVQALRRTGLKNSNTFFDLGKFKSKDNEFLASIGKKSPIEDVAGKASDEMNTYPRKRNAREAKKVLDKNFDYYEKLKKGTFKNKKLTDYKASALKASYLTGYDTKEKETMARFRAIGDFNKTREAVREYIDKTIPSDKRARLLDSLMKQKTTEGIMDIAGKASIEKERAIRNSELEILKQNLKDLKANKISTEHSMLKLDALSEALTQEELDGLLNTNNFSTGAVKKMYKLLRTAKESLKVIESDEAGNLKVPDKIKALASELDSTFRDSLLGDDSSPSMKVSVETLAKLNHVLKDIKDQSRIAKTNLVKDATNEAYEAKEKIVKEMKPVNEAVANSRETNRAGLYKTHFKPISAMNTLDLDNFTSEMGETMNKVAYKDMLAGQKRKVHHLAKGYRIVDDIIESFGKNKEDGIDNLNKTFTTVETADKHKYDITRDEAMAIYAMSTDRETQRIIKANKGLTLYLGDKKGSDSFTLSLEKLNEISKNLTPKEKEAVTRVKKSLAQDYLPELNAVHERLNGVPLRLLVDETYFPRTYMEDSATSKGNGVLDGLSAPYVTDSANADYASLLKHRGEGAQFRLRGLTKTYENYVDQASNYIGMAEPLKKFNRILDKGMEKEITQRYGAEYVDRLKRMTELNAGMAGKTKEDKQVLSRYLSNIAAAKLTPVSALKQFSSVPLASSVIPFKYLAKAMVSGLSKENIAEMMKLDDMVLRYRDNALGGIMPLNATNMEAERNLGTFRNKNILTKPIKWGLNLSLEADKRALGIIYKATRLMAEAQGRGNDSAYIENKFMEAVRRTQNTTDLASATGWQELSRKSSHWAFLNMYLNQTQKLPNEYIRLKRMITQAEKAHGKDSAQYKEARGNMVNFIIGMGLMNAMTLGLGAGAGALLRKKDEKKTAKETAAEMATDSLFNFVGNPILKPALGGSGYVLQKALPKSLGGKRQRTTNEAFGNDFSGLLPDATYTMSKMFEDLDGDEPAMRKLKKVTQDMLGSKSVESALAMGRVPTWYARYIYQLSNRFSDDSKTTKKSTGSTSLFKKRPQKKTRWKF